MDLRLPTEMGGIKRSAKTIETDTLLEKEII